MAARALSKTDELLRIAERPLRARDLDAAAIPRTYLARLVERGLIEKIDRGLYLRVGAEVTELHTLAEVAARVPHGVMCLLTALRVHGLTTESPHAVWLLIGRQARAPKLATPKLTVVRASGDALAHGIEERTVDGIKVRVTTPSKTVADCFRYRSRIGIDIAVEALRAYMQQVRIRGAHKRGYTMDALTASAKVDAMERVMRPYVQALQ